MLISSLIFFKVLFNLNINVSYLFGPKICKTFITLVSGFIFNRFAPNMVPFGLLIQTQTCPKKFFTLFTKAFQIAIKNLSVCEKNFRITKKTWLEKKNPKIAKKKPSITHEWKQNKKHLEYRSNEWNEIFLWDSWTFVLFVSCLRFSSLLFH